MTDKILSHFTSFRFTPSFWSLDGEARGSFLKGLEGALKATGACAYLYQLSALRADGDVLMWASAPIKEADDSARFFDTLGKAVNARREWIEPVDVLWGYTKPSQYARGQSAQEIDPLQPERQTYLVMYPFVKTVEWYLLSRDTRQGMMNQHIRIGHQYPEITQLLLYSFGLQEQEFVVVYETKDLNQFSDLVNELRSSEARRYTERDTPTYTAIYKTADALAALYAGGAA